MYNCMISFPSYVILSCDCVTGDGVHCCVQDSGATSLLLLFPLRILRDFNSGIRLGEHDISHSRRSYHKQLIGKRDVIRLLNVRLLQCLMNSTYTARCTMQRTDLMLYRSFSNGIVWNYQGIFIRLAKSITEKPGKVHKVRET